LPWALDADPLRSYVSPWVGFQCQPSPYGRLEFTHDFANGYPTDATVEKRLDKTMPQCEDYVSIVPGFALEILTNKGEHKGYVHLTGRCREDWLKNHPTDRCEKIAS
jgi:hypothetical protein